MTTGLWFPPLQDHYVLLIHLTPNSLNTIHHNYPPTPSQPPSPSQTPWDIQASLNVVLLFPKSEAVHSLVYPQTMFNQFVCMYFPSVTPRRQNLFSPFFMFLGGPLLFCRTLTILCHRTWTPLHSKYLGWGLISTCEWETWGPGPCLARGHTLHGLPYSRDSAHTVEKRSNQTPSEYISSCKSPPVLCSLSCLPSVIILRQF